ncbi:MAG: hypothetical protein KatS3mg032_2095 [Cyclobacteriaceae bacterium]|nr:MAG: hypothetical protein KatS3mg032_2095 [Cyclobacteriaceae bacterium]
MFISQPGIYFVITLHPVHLTSLSPAGAAVGALRRGWVEVLNSLIMKNLILILASFIGLFALAGLATLKANCPAQCTYGCGSIDIDPGTPYCVKSSANYCCIEKIEIEEIE